MLKLYVTNLAELPNPEECPELVGLLTAERQRKLKTLLQPEKQKQCLGAGILLRKVLASYGMSAEDVYIGENGKPEIDGLYFNLSHSKDFVVCAVSDCPVGCDIEKRREVPAQLAERFFSAEEKVYLASLSKEQCEKEFFRLWTRKESYAKMTGEGMARTLQKDMVSCYFQEYELDGYQISICTAEKKEQVTLEI